MDSRLSDYRSVKEDSSDESDYLAGSDDCAIDDSSFNFSSHLHTKKKFVIESSDESEFEPEINHDSRVIESDESELESENFHDCMQSTPISGCGKKFPQIPEISEKPCTSSEYFIDSDQETENESCLKPRKSTRVSLALSKLLVNDFEDVKTDDCCASKTDDLINSTCSDVFAGENEALLTKQEDSNMLSQNKLFNSGCNNSVDNDTLKISRDQERGLQGSKQRKGNNSGKLNEESVLVLDDSVGEFTFDSSENKSEPVKHKMQNKNSQICPKNVSESFKSICEGNSTEIGKLQLFEQSYQCNRIEKMKLDHSKPENEIVDLMESDKECNSSCIEICDEEKNKVSLETCKSNIHESPQKGTVRNNNSNIGSRTYEVKYNATEYINLTDQLPNVESKFNEIKISDVPIKKNIPEINQSRQQLLIEIDLLKKGIAKLQNIVKCIDISNLPDKGLKVQMKLQDDLKLLKIKERELSAIAVTEEKSIKETIKESVCHRLPAGFGVQALKTQIKEKTLTEEALSDLHGSINSCPSEDVMADAPLGLKSSVELMPHQKHALAWLLWRETQKPPGGILADDMGLGKTLTMISLILKAKQENENDDKDDYEEDMGEYPVGGTLVVCPASLLLQWGDEIKKHCKKGVLNVEIHHGTGREENARILVRNDLVLTTYSIVRTSANKGGKEESIKRSKRGVLHRVHWRRIILDEGHVVRNHKSQQSIAVCLLMGRKRWALTGTPIHNKELDLYALLKFLRCSPFDDYNVWRRWVDNKNTAGIKRLNTLINAIMLRRTKEVLLSRKELGGLPDKNFTDVLVSLDKKEFDVYTKILWLSKTLFAQFLQQKVDREMSGLPVTFSKVHVEDTKKLLNNHPEFHKMFGKLQEMHNIKTHEILVLLLRLRQVCVHPGLIKAMLNQEIKETADIEDGDELDSSVISKMESMTLKEFPGACLEESSEMEKYVMSGSNPIFDLTRVSSKMKAIFELLQEKILITSEKAIIVSQWTSVLNILFEHLKNFGVRCDILSGAIPVKDRMDIVNRFNDERSIFQVLLLSLTAGGVGLNLTGANHLLMVDLHWNPQLESQAFDRIYRVGQKKPVHIYRFICQETIEERIKLLQDKKREIASNVLCGTMRKNASKLTLDDLKSLFSM